MEKHKFDDLSSCKLETPSSSAFTHRRKSTIVSLVVDLRDKRGTRVWRADQVRARVGTRVSPHLVPERSGRQSGIPDHSTIKSGR
eukprot:scaffold29852_cov87-Cyclotella_meneghiniana.AAC.4